MKTSSILASVLLGTLAAAAPVKRDYVTKTELVVETVIVYTTVWDYGGAPSTVAAVQTSEPGLFYEKPAGSSEAPAPSSTPAAVVEAKPSSVYTPPASSSPAYTPAPEPTSVYTPPAPSSVYTPPPAPSSVYTPPAAPSSAAPQPSSPSTGTPSGGKVRSGDITIYQPAGNLGACGTNLQDSDAVVALSIEAFGASTYDYMTGEATNKWCGQKIMVQYGDREAVPATIMDMCPGCSGDDIDLSPAVWSKVTGVEEMTRYKATWWTV